MRTLLVRLLLALALGTALALIGVAALLAVMDAGLTVVELVARQFE